MHLEEVRTNTDLLRHNVFIGLTPHFKKLKISRSFFEKADIGFKIFKNGFFFFQPLEDINRLLVPYLQKGVEKNISLF